MSYIVRVTAKNDIAEAVSRGFTFDTEEAASRAADAALYSGAIEATVQPIYYLNGLMLNEHIVRHILELKRYASPPFVSCIKLLRNLSGCGLKEAKDFYDNLT